MMQAMVQATRHRVILQRQDVRGAALGEFPFSALPLHVYELDKVSVEDWRRYNDDPDVIENAPISMKGAKGRT